MLLVRRLIVAIPWRNHHTFDAELHHRIEKLAHAFRVGIVEERRIGGHPMSPLQRRLDGLHRDVIDAVPAHRQIVLIFQSVHVDAEREKLRRLILIEFPLHQNRIGTEIDVPFLCDQPANNRRHFGMDHRLSAGNADDRGSAFFGRRPTLLRSKSLIQHMVRVLNLSAAGTGQITPE